MLACAILNARSTTSELPLFARDIPAISVDQHTLTWAYTGTGGGHHIAVTSQSMIEVLVPSLTNPGPVEWDAMGLMDVQRLVFQINCPLIWDATSNDLVSNIELFVRLFLIIFGIFSCNFFLNNYY